MSPESCKAASDEERLLLKKISDLVRRSEKEYSVLYSSFLTPAEQCLISDETEFSGIVGFDGGYEDAERRMCRVCTDEFQRDEGAPLVLLCCEMSDRNADISHRDVLGSLMGLGIRREMIGDIMADGRTARFFCSKSVSEFIMQSLERIRKYLCSNPEKQRSHRATEGYIDLWLSDDAKKRTVPKSKGQPRKKESILEDEYADYETYSVVDILDRLKGFEDIAQDELPDSTNDRNDVVENTLDMSEMELYERSASSLPPDFF